MSAYTPNLEGRDTLASVRVSFGGWWRVLHMLPWPLRPTIDTSIEVGNGRHLYHRPLRSGDTFELVSRGGVQFSGYDPSGCPCDLHCGDAED